MKDLRHFGPIMGESFHIVRSKSKFVKFYENFDSMYISEEKYLVGNVFKKSYSTLKEDFEFTTVNGADMYKGYVLYYEFRNKEPLVYFTISGKTKKMFLNIITTDKKSHLCGTRWESDRKTRTLKEVPVYKDFVLFYMVDVTYMKYDILNYISYVKHEDIVCKIPKTGNMEIKLLNAVSNIEEWKKIIKGQKC